jgi:WD40 repeat protein
MSLSVDGTLALTSSRHGAVRLWDLRSTEKGPLARYKGHANSTSSFLRCGFGPREGVVLSGSDDGAIHCWDTASGKTLAVLRGHGLPPNSGLGGGGSGGVYAGEMGGVGGGNDADSFFGTGEGGGGSWGFSSLSDHGSSSSSSSGGGGSSGGYYGGSGGGGFGIGIGSVGGGSACYRALWSPRQGLLASCGEDGTVRTWCFGL